MGEKRRRVRCARRPERKHSRGVSGRNPSKQDQALSRASSKRGQQIAERLAAFIRMAAMQVDELAQLVDVLDGMLQRRLPGSDQR